MSSYRIPYPTDFAGPRNMTKQQWGVLINTTFPTANNMMSILNAWDLAHVKGLDVFSGHVAIVSQRRKVDGVWTDVESCWLTVKALIYLAHRTGSFAGIDPVQFGPTVTRNYDGFTRDEGGQNKKDTTTIQVPEYAVATVYRFVNGIRCAFSDTIFFDEMVAISQGVPNAIWRKKPALMLAKCAKSSALRLGFAECDYSADEMDGQDVVVDMVPETQPSVSDPTSVGEPQSADAQMGAATAVDPMQAASFSEAATSFDQLSPDTLAWLDRNTETAIGVGAFDAAIANLKATLNAEYHPIGENLIRAAETISKCPKGMSIFNYIGRARQHAATHGPRTFDQAIAEITKQESAGQFPKDVTQAATTVLTFLKVLRAAA